MGKTHRTDGHKFGLIGLTWLLVEARAHLLTPVPVFEDHP
jgi:hypothetical protein